MKLLHRVKAGLLIPIFITLSSCGGAGTSDTSSTSCSGCGSKYTGPGSVLADQLLSSVSYGLTTPPSAEFPPNGTLFNQILSGPCQRDSFVAAAIAEAWDANEQTWVGNFSTAAKDISAMCANLKSADSLCSNVSTFGPPIQCPSLAAYQCGANGTPGSATTKGCPVAGN